MHLVKWQYFMKLSIPWLINYKDTWKKQGLTEMEDMVKVLSWRWIINKGDFSYTFRHDGERWREIRVSSFRLMRSNLKSMEAWSVSKWRWDAWRSESTAVRLAMAASSRSRLASKGSASAIEERQRRAGRTNWYELKLSYSMLSYTKLVFHNSSLLLYFWWSTLFIIWD